MNPIRAAVFDYAEKKYGLKPEYPWVRYPEFAALKHADNQKMFGLFTSVPGNRIGLLNADPVEILSLKMRDPLLADMLVQQEGYTRGYHVSRGNWITVRLDGTVPAEDIFRLVDESFLATASAASRKKLRPPKEWIIPANPKYYDVQSAFREAEEINWKQGAGIKTGDTVYMYVASPVSAILYRCLVTETDIPSRFRKSTVTIKSLMRIRKLREYPPDRFTFDVLGKEYDIFAVRGPRGIPEKLSAALKK